MILGGDLLRPRPQTVPQVPRIGDCSMAYAMPHPFRPRTWVRSWTMPIPARTLGQHLQHAVPAAHRLEVSTLYRHGRPRRPFNSDRTRSRSSRTVAALCLLALAFRQSEAVTLDVWTLCSVL